MSPGRELLDIAVEYLRESERVDLLGSVGAQGVSEDDLDGIAGRWDAALSRYVSRTPAT